jgi:hypothetical protein
MTQDFTLQSNNKKSFLDLLDGPIPISLQSVNLGEASYYLVRKYVKIG